MRSANLLRLRRPNWKPKQGEGVAQCAAPFLLVKSTAKGYNIQKSFSSVVEKRGSGDIRAQ